MPEMDSVSVFLGPISTLQARYAASIADDRLEEWPNYFAENCLYRITNASDYRASLPAGIVYANSRDMLVDRVSALREANIYEPQAYRYILGLPLIMFEDNCSAESETPFLVLRIMRDGATDVFATGRYVDRFIIDDGMLRIAKRIVVCDSRRIDTLLAIPL